MFGTILCAAYGTAVKIVWNGGIRGEELLARPHVEQEFLASLGVRGTTGNGNMKIFLLHIIIITNAIPEPEINVDRVDVRIEPINP